MQLTTEEKIELGLKDQGSVNPAFVGKESDEQPQLSVDVGEQHAEALEENADKGVDLVYSLNDRPPWYLCILLGFQHYILAFGGIIAIPLILAEPLCIRDNNEAKSQLISTIFFVSGLCTLLQTAVGTRLPILQGGTFSFITPTLAILALPKWQCPNLAEPAVASSQFQNDTGPKLSGNSDELWMSRMREIQGAILVSSLIQIVIGFSGLVGFVLKYIGPLAIAPTINLIGLSLFIEAGKKSGAHWGIAALTVCLILLFSQYLGKVNVPMIAYKDKKWKVFQYPLFKLFSALFGMCGGWLVCFLLTVFDVLPSQSTEYGYSARTDISLDAVTNSPWFHVPYPGQWGAPTVSVSSVMGMMAGVLASTMESIGDYYACARLSGAPPPPTHAINRGIAIEGIGCIIAALWGTGNGTTSYSQNIAALGITKVGSQTGPPDHWDSYDRSRNLWKVWSSIHHHPRPRHRRHVPGDVWDDCSRGDFKSSVRGLELITKSPHSGLLHLQWTGVAHVVPLQPWHHRHRNEGTRSGDRGALHYAHVYRRILWLCSGQHHSRNCQRAGHQQVEGHGS
uniref:Si:dkey-106n21.1 n=1 Tax=Cynoglossus semilaevis TaxID=244447 RepID=A0A3P8X5W5_CYNSE